MKDEERMDALFNEMLAKGLISFSYLWIERAIETKREQLALGIAHSKELTYDRLDLKLAGLWKSN
jgi:hypothetical protein